MFPSRIAFLTVQLVFVYSAHSQTKSESGLSGIYPAWSASGNRIAFCSNSNGNYDIYTMYKNGTDIKQITSFPGNEYWPSWIGDRFIVFDADMHGNEELYSMRADGRKVKRLTFDTAAYDGVAAVSLRSHQIAFDSNRDQDKLADVWVMNRVGKRQSQLTQMPYSQGHPSWSPDEKQIAFKMKINEKVHEIYSMQRDGSGLIQITFHNAISQHPSWSPDGRSIVYTSNIDGDFDIHLFNVQSGKHTKLTDNNYADYRPTFSPDGQYILFCSKIDRAWEIRRLTVSTREVTTLFPR